MGGNHKRSRSGLQNLLKKADYPPVWPLNDGTREVRLNKIRELIELSQYSIHDLSRLKAKQGR